jgi:hypothetical protein
MRVALIVIVLVILLIEIPIIVLIKFLESEGLAGEPVNRAGN